MGDMQRSEPIAKTVKKYSREKKTPITVESRILICKNNIKDILC
jgi:hypothetical protein